MHLQVHKNTWINFKYVLVTIASAQGRICVCEEGGYYHPIGGNTVLCMLPSTSYAVHIQYHMVLIQYHTIQRRYPAQKSQTMTFKLT